MYTQNWDSVVAPAVPSDWVVDPAITTTTTPFGTSPFSSPNVLTCSTTGAYKYATYQTRDSNNGDVTVTGTFAHYQHPPTAPTYTGYWGFSVFARGNSSTLAPETTQYEGRITLDSGVAAIYSNIGSVDLELGWADISILQGTWYQMSLQLAGTALNLSVQRMSDGYSLNSAGSFVSGQTTAVSVTDSSITGAGYAGIALYTASSAVFADDFILANYPPAAFDVLPGIMTPRRRRIEDRNVTRLFG
jgi:hypothetical protein